MIIGLTGQSGAGKTTACDIFKQEGFAVINCDIISRDVVSNSQQCLNELVDYFSDKILNDDKTLNRKELGKIVFADNEKRNALNKMIHPYIIDQIEKDILTLKSKNSFAIILDAPTLFESGANTLCDKIVSIIANKNILINRIISRDNLSKEEATNRIHSQHDSEFFVEKSDYVAYNNGDIIEFKKSVKQIATKLKEEISGNKS